MVVCSSSGKWLSLYLSIYLSMCIYTCYLILHDVGVTDVKLLRVSLSSNLVNQKAKHELSLQH